MTPGFPVIMVDTTLIARNRARVQWWWSLIIQQQRRKSADG